MSVTDPKPLLCQECRGYGRICEETILGHNRMEVCGWCAGTGEITPELRGVWLSEQRDRARGRRQPREQQNP
jgi:DnaJ-class molecular chaperone